MSIGGFFLGLINIGIVVVVLLLFGYLVKMIMANLMKMATDEKLERLYLALVGLIALYMLAALFFGLPSFRIL